MRQKKAKNLLLMFAKVNLGVKKIVSSNAKIFVLCIFLANMSNWHSKSKKIDFLQVFLIFTEGI